MLGKVPYSLLLLKSGQRTKAFLVIWRGHGAVRVVFYFIFPALAVLICDLEDFDSSALCDSFLHLTQYCFLPLLLSVR